jgi:hypothetical protein
MVFVLFALQLYPGPDHGSAENTIDSIQKLYNSSTLIFLVLFYLISIAIFNVLGMTVSKHLSSVHRTLIDSSRSVVVWGFQLVAWHLLDSKTYGTPWTSNSWIQLVGFIVLVVGTLVYNDVLVVFRSRQPEETASELLPMVAGSNE